MIRLGMFLGHTFSCAEYKMNLTGQMWQRIGFGLWRSISDTAGDELDKVQMVQWFYKESCRMIGDTSYGFRCGLLVRKGSFWIGVHYAPINKRFCINLIPCVTLWVTLKDGKVP